MTINSMTGIGDARITRNGFDINVLIKSVNHRFLQLQVRLPRGYYEWEKSIRDRVSGHIYRGKTDIFVEIFSIPPETQNLIVNNGLADSITATAEAMTDRYKIPSGLTAERLLRFSDMISHAPVSLEKTEFSMVLDEVVGQALEKLIEERRCEGEKLCRDLQNRIELIRTCVNRISVRADQQADAIRKRLETGIEKIAASIERDDEKLEQEVIFMALKADVTEEIIRLLSHLDRLAQILAGTGPVGKRCDFLIQELHREATTIASKSAVKEISEFAVDLRSEIEKMREQIQNIE